MFKIVIINVLAGDDIVKTIAIFGENKNEIFLPNIRTILNVLGVDLKFILDENICAAKYFDYIIVFSNNSFLKDSFNCGYCFIGMDETQKDTADIYGNIIAYGFGTKNTVTVSSIESENGGFVYCLQRYLNVNALRMLEPQEIPINIEFHSEVELYAYMVSVTIALIEGVSSAEIENKLALKPYVEIFQR